MSYRDGWPPFLFIPLPLSRFYYLSLYPVLSLVFFLFSSHFFIFSFLSFLILSFGNKRLLETEDVSVRKTIWSVPSRAYLLFVRYFLVIYFRF